MFNSATRYELLEELANLALECRHMIASASPEGARFQELVDILSVRERSHVDHDVGSLLHAIGRSDESDKQSLYRRAAALIPV